MVPGAAMGLDADVLLRVRDRAALAAALEAYAVADRQDWREQGRVAEYDQLLREAYDPTPLLRRHADGSVSIFTGLSFGGDDAELSIRCWLHAHFGDRLSRIHDDARGVFVSPDVSATRAKTYEGIVEELAGVGRFVDPSPPTAEEHRLWSGQTIGVAEESSDLAALGEALLGAPAEISEARARQAARVARISARLGGRGR